MTDYELKAKYGYGFVQEPYVAPVMNFGEPEPVHYPADLNVLPQITMSFDQADDSPQRGLTCNVPQQGHNPAPPQHNAAGGHSGGQQAYVTPAWVW